MKLLCDQMLGTLATWLRIFGYDAYFATQQTNDKELLRIAKSEQRTIISRDKDFLIQAKKELIPIIELQTTDLDEQLKTVLHKIPIEKTLLLSRCTLCNTPLQTIEKTKIKNQVPKKIYEQHDTFWYCATCSKVYWMGTHYTNMVQKFQNLVT